MSRENQPLTYRRHLLYRGTKKSATASLRRSHGVFVRNRYCPPQAPPAENCLQFFRGLKNYITHVFVMLTRMWSSEARGSTCASTAVGRCISHVLVNSRPTGHNSLCPVGLRERLRRCSDVTHHPVRVPVCLSLILAYPKGDPWRGREENTRFLGYGFV